MKTKINNEELIARITCQRLLGECISFDHIEDMEYIISNLKLIKEQKHLISKEARREIEKYIKDKIRPIVYDKNYFDFMIREEFGEYDKKGHFVINSEESLIKMILLLYSHTLELEDGLNDFIWEHLYKGVC